MAAKDDNNNGKDNDKDRALRDLLLFLLLLLLGFACLLIAAEAAVRPEFIWQVSANMRSKLNPDEEYEAGEVPIVEEGFTTLTCYG